jgi:hypothetical protein
MSCKKGFGYCEKWDGPMEDCPGCEEAKKTARAVCSVCGLMPIIELKVSGQHFHRDLEVCVRCPNCGDIKFKSK